MEWDDCCATARREVATRQENASTTGACAAVTISQDRPDRMVSGLEVNAVGEDTSVSGAKPTAASHVGQCWAGNQQQLTADAAEQMCNHFRQVHQQQQQQCQQYMSPGSSGSMFMLDFYQRNLFERLVLPAATAAVAAAAAAATATAAASLTTRQRRHNDTSHISTSKDCTNLARRSESRSAPTFCPRMAAGGAGSRSTLSCATRTNIEKPPRRRRKRRRFRKRKQRHCAEATSGNSKSSGVQQQAVVPRNSNDDEGVLNNATIESERGDSAH